MTSNPDWTASSPPEICLNLPVRELRLLLMVVIGLLFTAHVLTQFVYHFYPIDSSLLRMAVETFDLNSESNLSTWYASSSLLVCAMLVGFIWHSERRGRGGLQPHWLGLALMALAFSVDEVACLHERLNGPLRSLVGAHGFLRFPWVVAGLVFVAAVITVYRGFFRSLPRRIRWRLGVATLVYFTGSLGLEMLGGKWSDMYGRQGFGYSLMTGFEELAEMVGVLIFLECLMLQVRSHSFWLWQPKEASQRVAA